MQNGSSPAPPLSEHLVVGSTCGLAAGMMKLALMPASDVGPPLDPLRHGSVPHGTARTGIRQDSPYTRPLQARPRLVERNTPHARSSAPSRPARRPLFSSAPASPRRS